MTTAVDTAVLIDIFQDEPEWAARSADALHKASRSGRVVACDVVWAEVSGRFGSTEAATAAMQTLGVEFDPLDEQAASGAGVLWRLYRESGGSRERVVADFLVGAHALHRADALLTRDRGYYRKYFKRLRILAPVLLFFAAAMAPLAAQAIRAVERVSIEDLKAMMAAKTVVILDVRTEQEFADGHIPGAININYTMIANQAARLSGEKRTIVAYCACANEMTAARASVDLAARGIPGAKALKGGWDEWVSRKEAIEK